MTTPEEAVRGARKDVAGWVWGAVDNPEHSVYEEIDALLRAERARLAAHFEHGPDPIPRAAVLSLLREGA